MNAFEEYDIGSAVSCGTEPCGHPVAGRLTHLIVVARDGTAGRLVPVELAAPGAGGVVLDCTKDEFGRLEPSVAIHFLADPDAERVAARDGHIGRVRGLVVDPAGEGVTHVLLDEGHLWGHKRVAIPVGAVSGIDAEGVAVELTKHQIKYLPSVEVSGLD